MTQLTTIYKRSINAENCRMLPQEIKQKIANVAPMYLTLFLARVKRP